jgi:hypothetical protein
MDYSERLASYEERGFRSDAAAVNVLIEVTLQALFSHFPEQFVFIGGASLVLFYGSKRHSADLDLWLASAQAPRHEELLAVIQPSLTDAAQALRHSSVSIKTATPLGEVARFSVLSGENLLFTIDLTRIGAVIKSEVTSFPLKGLDNSVSIPVPTRNLSLLFKVEAFLTRKRLKARDAFDIKLLVDSGAKLTDTLKIHLEDGPAADRIEDPGYIAKRIQQVNASVCRPELESVLPQETYRELEARDFQSLRETLTRLFSEWL